MVAIVDAASRGDSPSGGSSTIAAALCATAHPGSAVRRSGRARASAPRLPRTAAKRPTLGRVRDVFLRLRFSSARRPTTPIIVLPRMANSKTQARSSSTNPAAFGHAQLQSLMPTAYVTYGKFIQFVVIKKCEFMLVRAGTPEGGSCLTYLFWDTRILAVIGGTTTIMHLLSMLSAHGSSKF